MIWPEPTPGPVVRTGRLRRRTWSATFRAPDGYFGNAFSNRSQDDANRKAIRAAEAVRQEMAPRPCLEPVDRAGVTGRCGQPAVANRRRDEGAPGRYYPVCIEHVRPPMLTLRLPHL